MIFNFKGRKLSSYRSERSSVLFRIILASAVIIWIWLPEFTLWHVSPASLSPETIERSRKIPELSVLNELGRIDLKLPASLLSHKEEVIRQAENITKGVLTIPGFPEIQISPVFSPNDLQKYPQLLIASLIVVDQLLDAHQITGREEFFRLAKENVLSFARFESSRILDTQMLWNDHSISARISALIKFWAQYREREDFNSDEARLVLNLIVRSGLLLVKPEHYAWRTDHGIMANIALLQISTAFPFIEESKYFREVAMQRFSSHLPYYVNKEGVTLIHSAGYNISGIQFLATMMRLFTLNGVSIPSDWWMRYEKATSFYARLRRPDGTLPMFGDTPSKVNFFGPQQTNNLGDGSAAPLEHKANWLYQEGLHLYPESGHAIWWYPHAQDRMDALSQTVATWSYYPKLGHKHADELSVLIWAGGRDWITNIGYWPYGFQGRTQMESSWNGSNAPHLRYEPVTSSRSSKVIRTGTNNEVFFIEMERAGPDNFKAHREVMQIGANTWIVLDRLYDDVQRETETFWTFYPDLTVTPGQTAGSFIVSTPHFSQIMHCSFQTNQGRNSKQFSGEWDPFSGWVVINNTPVPAKTISTYADSAQGWQLAVFTIHDRLYETHDKDLVATLSDISDIDRWTITVSGIEKNSEVTITRDQKQINIWNKNIAPANRILKLNDVSDPQGEIALIHDAIKVADENSLKQSSLIPYRLKVTYVLLMLLVIQETLFLVLRCRMLAGLYMSLRTVSIMTWVSTGLLLTKYYLVAN